MASTEVQQALPTNGANDQAYSHSSDVGHEDTTGPSPVEPTPEQNIPATGLEEAGAEQLRSGLAQPEETAVSPVSDKPLVVQSAASSKQKPTTSPTKRPTPTVQTTTTKGASGPPTPQVKKILNSGKFGAGVTKAVPPPISKATDTPTISGKPSTTVQTSFNSKTAPSSNPAAKKSSESTSAPSSKAAMPPKPSTGPSAPTRRSSLVAKPTGPARSSTLATSTSGKLSSATTSSAATRPAAPQRASVASPDSTTSAKSAAISRPRASVSEAVIPKKAAAPRASLAPSAKPPTTSTARPARTPGVSSISSLKGVKEVKESSADIGEIQSKLDEATVSLDLKTSRISELETRVDDLKATLDNITADLEATRQNLESAERAKATSEKEHVETRAALVVSQGERDKLEQVSYEEATRKTAAEQNAVVETLQEQIKALQAEVDESRTSLESLRAERADDSAIAAAAEIDQQTLVKARADLEAIKYETAALKAAQAEASDAATAKISALELEASRAEALATEITSLRAEKEETSNKLSELEVEILELKEAQELAEEERGNSKAQTDSLRDEVAAAAAATEKAVQEAVAKESAAAERLEKIKTQHEEALALAQEECKRLTEQLHASQAEVDELRKNLGVANAVAASAADEHARHLAEAGQVHKARQDELIAEFERVSAELAAQEAVYNAKVQTVKDEHEQLLQQAFERAKNEAGDAHGQDLQTLREKFEAATEQLRTSHQATIEGLKADHEAELDSRAQSFQMQQSTQALELKATTEDLAKAKAKHSTVSQEVESLKSQLDELRQAAQVTASTAAADQDAEIARLTKELSNAREDLNGVNEIFRATQDSMREMGNNHQMELEEAAKGRADEVSKLRAAHDVEIQSLVADKASLVTRLSDLEGEMLTLRASAASAATTASPKRNGTTMAPSETVTKEELQRAHEAHNLKMNDLQAQHDKQIRALQEQVEFALTRAQEAETDLDRKKMEITYLEQDSEESQDQITRLKEDVGRLMEKLSSSTE